MTGFIFWLGEKGWRGVGANVGTNCQRSNVKLSGLLLIATQTVRSPIRFPYQWLLSRYWHQSHRPCLYSPCLSTFLRTPWRSGIVLPYVTISSRDCCKQLSLKEVCKDRPVFPESSAKRARISCCRHKRMVMVDRLAYSVVVKIPRSCPQHLVMFLEPRGRFRVAKANPKNLVN